MPPRLFGTDGIRGPANIGKLSPPAMSRLGLALAHVLRSEAKDGEPPRALIGRDTRISGPALSAAITSGLLAGGVEVHDGGVLPTPAVALLARRGGYAVGIVVSASHNPWQDNGVKLLGSHGRKLDDDEEEAVEAAYARDDLESGVVPENAAPRSVLASADADYIRAIQGELRGLSLRGMRIAVDAGHGAQCDIAATVLRKFGARVFSIGDQPNGRNINAKCGALHPRALRRVIKEHQAHIGVAFDGDADRLQLVDENGKLLDGDVVLAALAPRLLARRKLPKRTVVGTLMTNGGLGEALAESGISLIRTAVGDRNIVAAMVAHGYGLGGEPSGHMIVPRRGLLTGDALYAALACLRIVAEERIPASALRGTFKPWPLKLISMPVKDRPPIDSLKGTSAAISAAEETLGERGRVVVRYSGTEPKVRVMVEARRRQLVNECTTSIVSAIEAELGA